MAHFGACDACAAFLSVRIRILAAAPRLGLEQFLFVADVALSVVVRELEHDRRSLVAEGVEAELARLAEVGVAEDVAEAVEELSFVEMPFLHGGIGARPPAPTAVRVTRAAGNGLDWMQMAAGS